MIGTIGTDASRGAVPADQPGTVQLYVTAAAGTADLLAEELAAFGAGALHVENAGVSCQGSLETAYRICLWSRVGVRVLWPVATFSAVDADGLYAGVRGVDWTAHLGAGDTLAVDFSARAGSGITHSHYGALRVKDAIVDQFRERDGTRPSVDVAAPAVRINVRMERDAVTVAVDLAGDSLHRRGYRARQLAAPLKENVAAAILLRSGWPQIAAAGGSFVDPMCGSGTLPIEAALMACDIAPGILRERFGFSRWRGHDEACWQRLLVEAQQRRAAGRIAPGRILGFDRDASAVRVAADNAERAGLQDVVGFRRCELAVLPVAPAEAGLFAVNPPYGERMGSDGELEALYALLGERLREGYVGWQAAVFTGNPPLGRALGIEARRAHRMYNGALECRLLRLDVDPARYSRIREPGRPPPFDAEAALARPGSQMFANRLRKNLRQLRSWARRETVSCYRLYDADMPEYSFAIDLYQSDPEGTAGRWLYVQEYAAPAEIDRGAAKARREEALAALPGVTGIAVEHIYMRTRRRQKGAAQYEKLAELGQFETVEEGGLKFLVNFTDYLDTGLFLDHRPLRAQLRDMARGKRFLNLFAYTGTASVCAAAGGAAATLTVDLSHTYLDWAARNLQLNGLSGRQHVIERADCLAWLARDDGRRFDLVFLDPPTFSNSKSMASDFDVQRDHVALIKQAAGRLAPDGLLLFSTNLRRFKLDTAGLGGLEIRDITGVTVAKDFARNARAHHCFEIRRS